MRWAVRIPAIVITAAGAAFLAYQCRRLLPSTGAQLSNYTTSALYSATRNQSAMARGAVIALSHGGGPMPVLGDPASAELAASLRTRVPAVLHLDDADPARRPKAIVLVTAHWSQQRPSVSSGTHPKLLYDYGGFPAAAYKLRYDAPGSPAVARRVAEVLAAEGLAPQLDDTRGWDHGVFVPLLLVRPQADIPVVQVSVLDSEDPSAHFAMGRALGRLRDEGVAIVGSGFASFHNLRHMFSGITQQPHFRAKLKQWNAVMGQAVALSDPLQRDAALRSWRSWPMAYDAHPRGGADHFMPLIVCAGAAGEGVAKSYVDDYVGLDIHSYYWE